MVSRSSSISTPPLRTAQQAVFLDGAPASSGWTVSATALQRVTAERPQAIGVAVTGLAEGNAGLKYQLRSPSVRGSDGLVANLLARITVHPAGHSCQVKERGDAPVLFEGPLVAASVGPRAIVDAGAKTGSGAEVLCAVLSLPADYGVYDSTASVTADTAEGSVLARTKWHGAVEPNAADRSAVVVWPVDTSSFRSAS